MQNNSKNITNPNVVQNFDFKGETIRIWQNSDKTFSFSAGDIFRILEYSATSYQTIYDKLKVAHIAPNQPFRDGNGDLITIKMLSHAGLSHLVSLKKRSPRLDLLHWAEKTLPTLVAEREQQNNYESIDFQGFNFENEHTVRVFLDENGNPWFAGIDVCNVLGYLNSRDIISKHCKSDGVSKRYIIDALKREQSITIINEPNLYRLIIGSQKPEAERFEKWVFEKVLPILRKTGKYEIAPKNEPNEIDLQTGFTTKQMAFLKDLWQESIQQIRQNTLDIEQIKKLLPTLMPKPINGKTSYVYLMQNLDNCLCKIGKSNTPHLRKGQIQSGGSEISVLATLKVPSEELALFWEDTFQKMFEEYSKGREWFSLNEFQIKTLMDLIGTLNNYYERM